ncbi:Acg family FMN-binding oxidoreductase [Piscinibacter defluvii]|uniref:Acg family FMN-binding oxidoreductase n=1 Tax=Piscinibacter defluvii TaxID=1796922 RepID=UPI000FDEF550|nr:Tat pathway signal protein [Piscinibacter defluvii]
MQRSFRVTRRRFATASLAAGAPALLPGCAPPAGVMPYEEAVRALWRHGAVDRGDAAAVRRELVRCATLAPSSHNTQCWRFGIEPQAITILPDLTRRCPAVDPDDHHLFVSLGCAAENLVQAARAHGLEASARFDGANKLLRLALEPTAAQDSPLFQAIPRRQSTRAEYDGRPLSADELRALERAAAGDGVQLVLLTGKPALEEVLAFVVQGNSAQMNDPAFVDELRAWIRFSAGDAVRLGDGLYSASSGNPSVPAWLGRLMFGFFFTEKGENDKYARQVRSSAGIAVFVGPSDDPAGRIAAGRAYERFALQATALGVRTAHLNQPVEVAALRPAFAGFLGLPGRRPDLVLRFGRGPTLPPSLRRPLQAVLA